MQNCTHNEEHERIMDFIDRILALTPQSADEWENQAFIYKILGEPKKAISCLKKAIELKPEGLANYEKVGNLFSEIREYSTALKY